MDTDFVKFILFQLVLHSYRYLYGNFGALISLHKHWSQQFMKYFTYICTWYLIFYNILYITIFWNLPKFLCFLHSFLSYTEHINCCFSQHYEINQYKTVQMQALELRSPLKVKPSDCKLTFKPIVAYKRVMCS